jgi:hypothetical protein
MPEKMKEDIAHDFEKLMTIDSDSKLKFGIIQIPRCIESELWIGPGS